MNKFTNVLLAASLMLTASAASAVSQPITGSIGFTGSFTIWDTDAGAFTNSFLIGDEILVANDAEVTGAPSGSFADEGITAGDSASHADIIYNPTGGITDLWSVGTFTFDLNSMVVTFVNADSIILDGVGVVSSTNADLVSSVGTWNFSANTQGSSFTWSSSTAVPEPAVAMLLGIGLLGFAASRKLRKA